MHLGLFQTGDGAEEILDAAGIAGHGMGLQFTDINDIIGFHNGSDQVKAVIFKSFRTVYGQGGKVHVQFCVLCQSIHAAYMIHMLHGFGIVETTGAFCNGDMLHALFPQPADHRFYHQWMCGGRKIRGFCHDEVGLDDDLHLRSQICSNIQCIHAFADGGIDQFFVIFRYDV